MKTYFSLLLLFFASQCFAQIENIKYYDRHGFYTDIADSVYYVQYIRPDSASSFFNVEQYYKNGRPKLIGKSTSILPLKFDGNVIEYYDNAKRKAITNYNNGEKIGSVYEYFPSGKLYLHKEYNPKKDRLDSLNFTIKDVYDTTGIATATDGNGLYNIYDKKFAHITETGPIKNGKRNGDWKGAYKGRDITFIETYADGELLAGEAVSMGQKSTYKKRFTAPSYPKGDNGFARFLASHIHYPSIDRQNNIQGKIVVTFVVEKDGKVTNVKILKSLSPTTDEQAVNVIIASSPWTNGVEFGFPARVQFSMPINFTLGTD